MCGWPDEFNAKRLRNEVELERTAVLQAGFELSALDSAGQMRLLFVSVAASVGPGRRDT